MTITLKRIAAEETYPLRHRILRPNQTLADCAYPLDHQAESYHVGGYIDGELVGVGTILQEAQENISYPPHTTAWRIRGMAVSETARGKGIGGMILESLIAYVAEQSDAGEIWCNGRVSVKGFYQRYGFAQIGDVFDLPSIGAHVVMSRPI